MGVKEGQGHVPDHSLHAWGLRKGGVMYLIIVCMGIKKGIMHLTGGDYS